MTKPTTSEVILLGAVTVCATVAGVFNVLSGEALAGVYGAVIGWGGRSATSG